VSHQPTTREGVERAAADWRRESERRGQPMSDTQARERVERAVREGDRKRENGGR